MILRGEFMRKLCALLFVLIICISISACKAPEDKILMSLGEYNSNVYYTQGEFQDFTDYAKYYYDSVDLTGNEYFNKIQKSDATKINEHLDDFESWIETYRETDSSREIVMNYDFDRTIIDSEDYFYIDSEKLTTTWDDGTTTTTLANYDVYFFDTQTQILYYFHNNI